MLQTKWKKDYNKIFNLTHARSLQVIYLEQDKFIFTPSGYYGCGTAGDIHSIYSFIHVILHTPQSQLIVKTCCYFSLSKVARS